MGFSASVKADVRKRAWFACCVCKKISLALEVHHIVPLSDGGTDIADNAAPLCASCHRSFGGNRELQSRIREMRDDWYKKCHAIFVQTFEPAEVFRSIHDLFTMEEIERLTVHNPCYVLGSGGERRGERPVRFSFCGDEYVHPLIVRELIGWISDRHETIVGVDLEAANRSNRFLGDVRQRQDGEKRWIIYDGKKESFCYSFVATTPSGIDILECHDWLGGSGVFGTVALLSVDTGQALAVDDHGLPTTRRRSVLTIVGQRSLGDRYSGRVWYDGGVLRVAPDQGWFQRGEDAAWHLPVL